MRAFLFLTFIFEVILERSWLELLVLTVVFAQGKVAHQFLFLEGVSYFLAFHGEAVVTLIRS